MTHNADTHKRCCRCKEVKERGAFYKNIQAYDSLDSRCIKCFKSWEKAHKEWMKENQPEAYKKIKRDKRRKYNLRNPEKRKAARKLWKKNNPEKVSAQKLRTKRRQRVEEKKTKLALAFIKTIGKVAK